MDLKSKTQYLLELFIVNQFSKNQNYQIHTTQIQNMSFFFQIGFKQKIQLSFYQFKPKYLDFCINLDNQKFIAEIYFASQNEEKLVQYQKIQMIMKLNVRKSALIKIQVKSKKQNIIKIQLQQSMFEGKAYAQQISSITYYSKIIMY
ncbi:hypothetical protein pb186bvf_002623 [Paramecium bursaria]